MYAAVNTTLYRYFAIVGGPYQIGAIVSAIVLTVLVRRQPAIFRWTLAGTLLLIAAFVSRSNARSRSSRDHWPAIPCKRSRSASPATSGSLARFGSTDRISTSRMARAISLHSSFRS